MLIIESIHENIIKIEDGDTFFTISAEQIKGAYKEGDIIVLNDDGLYEIDKSATDNRRKSILDLQDDLFS